MGNPIGVITEQGYPAGQFGFDKLTEADQKKLNEQAANKETKKQSK